MKKSMGLRIFLSFIIYTTITWLVFAGINYPSVTSAYLDTNIKDLETRTTSIAEALGQVLTDFENEVDYLTRDINHDQQGKRYLIQQFKSTHPSVNAIYLYDHDRQPFLKTSDDDIYEIFMNNEIKELFFYRESEWVALDGGAMAIYYKATHGETFYMSMIVDIQTLIGDALLPYLEDIQIVDSYLQNVALSQLGRPSDEVKGKLSSLILKDHIGVSHIDGKFLGYGSVPYKPLDLFIIVTRTDQTYGEKMRSYQVRLIILGFLMMTVGFLVAWRMTKGIYKDLMNQKIKDNYGSGELRQIRDELDRAIHWIEDVVLHYDELNLLKEDLKDLSKKLPKAGDGDEKKKNDKKTK